MIFNNSLMRSLIAAALVGVALQACDDSNPNSKPTDDSVSASTNAGSGGKAGSGKPSGAAGKSSGTGGNSSSAGAGGNASGAAGAGGKEDVDSGTATGDCKGADDCYSCTPTKNDEFLNHCTEATCNPFDNSKLTRLKNGTLPAIP